MDVYDSIKETIDLNIFSCLIPLLLFIFLVGSVFKNRFQTIQVINLVRWFLILYFVIGLVRYIIGPTWITNEIAFSNRATGPYWFAYWLMFFSAAILPFTLFYKKLALKPLYLILIVIFIRIGWYFERFVIFVINIHRDYLPYNGESAFLSLWIKGILIQILQGVFLGIILLGIFEIKKRRKTAHNSKQK
ncbi:MAG: hypothetical protein IR153_02700 [Flavobacterium sp.]|nr:hypothetical protein [Flavobacterium sp.]